VREVTIRNDLDIFESKKLLIRSRGGAMKYEGSVRMDHQITYKNKKKSLRYINYKKR